ncbi:3-hydroxyisobutyrate dehydrogenase, mitochondrial [Lachnellula subtilissima]|uniref:3-hydroxyisobutyrate dehydrogenase n=1 Tax=Lachnellula subtilissima TaxID=602034 RepID=A0A8H8S198_9HELO|nr:3-hydroxyisobutyrate dehydrogenase, mitochondrial [Lachnellula subtilissima]
MAIHYGFIGLGAMGYPMALNIRRKASPGSTLYIYDVHSPFCEKFVAENSSYGPIKVVSSAREVADMADIIISIIPAASHVKIVYLDAKNGIIAAKSNQKRLMLECSTIDAQTARDVGNAILDASSGIYIDTPVSGGVPGALAGTLSFMIGSQEPSAGFDIHPQLEVTMSMMGTPSKFFYCGKLGAGLAAKISNNYLSGTILLASAEAMAIGIKSGIDKHLLYKVIHSSTGQSFMCDHVNPVPGVVAHAPASRDYEGGFKAQMMVKDMTLGVDAAAAVGIKPSTGQAALELYKQAAVDSRCIDRDVSVVYRFLNGPE